MNKEQAEIVSNQIIPELKRSVDLAREKVSSILMVIINLRTTVFIYMQKGEFQDVL